MSILGSYANGFAPRDGQPLYPELWRGCIGAWAPCLGPTGLTLRDWSGFGRNGTLTNMDPDTDWIVSGGHYSLDYDGSNDRVVFPSSIITGTGDFTITNHFRINTGSRFHTLQGNYSAANGTGIQFGVFNTNRLFAFVASGSSLIGSTTLAVGTWYFGACVRREGVVTIFVNGTADASGTRSGSVGGSTVWRIGQGDTGEDFAGRSNDCRVYDRALSTNELARLQSRIGIAYELAPRRRSRIFTGGFKAYWAARKAQLIGGGL
jgi:hypothetical protein